METLLIQRRLDIEAVTRLSDIADYIVPSTESPL
jgi:hypothetical protein